MYERKLPVKKVNGIDITFFVIGGKWKRDIIYCLNSGIKRPSELQRHLSRVGACARVLRQQLRELENYGVIYKIVYTVVPFKVEYHLTELGKELIPLFDKMNEWGNKYEHQNKDFPKSFEEETVGTRRTLSSPVTH
jgi:DNA-binding HxlR family transcriptional regulator